MFLGSPLYEGSILSKEVFFAMKPLASDAAVQMHLFIFSMAMTHILLGVLVMLGTYLRMMTWRRWTAENDPQTLA